MAGSDQLAGAIEPGSTGYGDRQSLEQGLSAALGSAGGPSPEGAGAQAAVQPGVDAPDDPLAALLNGSITPPASDLPQTTGLSVGPGAGPFGVASVSPEQSKIQQVATQAKNPLIRQMARNELRRIAGEQA